MSYDLVFTPGSKSMTADDFSTFFGSRRGYELKDTQAWYSNEDTGVYFSFDYTAEQVTDDPEAPASVASFNLNYLRALFFALEAASELSAFVGHFGLGVNDPQMDGMRDGPYSEEGFLRGWQAGNRFAHHSIIQREGAATIFPSLPEKRLVEAWRWNFGRETLQQREGDAVFVPKIFLFQIDDRVVSAVIWGDAIPALIPAVDVVLVARDELARRKFLSRKRDAVPISLPDLESVLGAFPRSNDPHPHVRLIYDSPPANIVQFVRSLPPTTANIQPLAADKVLSREMLAAALNAPPLESMTFGPDAPAT